MADAAPTATIATAGLLQRILLTTDGNVGRILENYAGESIIAARLEQTTTRSGAPNPALELRADEKRLTRRVLLRTSATDCPLLYAETLAALERLHPVLRSGLLTTGQPIGRLFTAARLETYRDILSTGTQRAGHLAEHFAIDRGDDLFTRTYRIIHRRRPIMLITEKFPTTWFL